MSYTLPKSQKKPVTVDSLVDDFKQLGVHSGMTLLVHSSLSSLGWVCGGPVAVIFALEQVIGSTGTLVMPTQSAELSDPKTWSNPPVPESWWETIRATMPAYDQDFTPTLGMGAIPETFRKQSGTLRSSHPQLSFAAKGTHAKQITENHSLDNGLGEQSPLARMYDLEASILLLGVGHESSTSFHLAENRAEYSSKIIKEDGAPILINNTRQWQTFTGVDFDEEDFCQIGAALELETKIVQQGFVGNTTARLMPLCAGVDFAVQWLNTNR